MAHCGNVIFEVLDKALYNRREFDCGVVELNKFIEKYASQQQEKHLSKVYVAVLAEARMPKSILGYYTLSTGSLSFGSFSEKIVKNIPQNYPIPTIKIGRLARNLKITKSGFGRKLLGDALLRALKFSSEIGAFAIDVNAKNVHAKEFYKSHGFVELQDDPLGLIIPIQTLLNSLKIEKWILEPS